MTKRTNRREIEIEPGTHLLRAENDPRAAVLLVVRGKRVEVWLRRDGAEWQ